MVYLILTRQGLADLADQLDNRVASVWINPGVLEDDELAQIQAGGVELHVLPRAVGTGSHDEIEAVLDQIRRKSPGTIWVEQPARPSQAVQQQAAGPEAPARHAAEGSDHLVASAATDSLPRWAWRQLKRFSASDGPAIILPYIGFGTSQRVELQGRVIRNEDFSPPSPARSGWSNLRELYRRIDSREVPGATVLARLGDVEQAVVANDHGYFRVVFDLPQPLPGPGWHEVQLQLAGTQRASEATAPTRAQVLVPPASARFGVISDIDDTILWSNVGNKLKMLKMLALTNAHTRKPFKGVAAFYRALRDGVGGDDGNPLFYVSSSPWHLFTPLVDFLQTQGIPLGPLMLKELGVKQLFGRDRHQGHKLLNIERIMAAYPALPFILIGDSGQEDPEIYREVVRRYPERVRAIYIRNVNPDPSRIEALDALIDELRTTGTQLLLTPDSEAAAAHAAAEGLIQPLKMQQVRMEKQDDSKLLAPRI
ncbi:MAG: hypothetical protein JWP36_49 [Paucimonas sp.]|nr:hypothetical protein [Paucimonas sp.]